MARRTKYVKLVLAHATAHDRAKSVANMGKLIRETVRVKKRYVARFGLSAGDRFRMNIGVAKLYTYLLAVRMGFRRAATPRRRSASRAR